MTSLVHIVDDIAKGEGQQREFKLKIDHPESIAGELVAFANSDGGILYVGIDDDGTIVGIQQPDQEFQRLTNICRDRCIPPISPIINQQQVQGKELLLVTIAPEFNRVKPYRTAGGRFYIRSGRIRRMPAQASLD